MDLLRALTDGKFHSGVVLADSLGVSRTTISNRLSYWRDKGVPLDSVNGKGYRLSHPLQFWDADQLRHELTTTGPKEMINLDVCESTTSTNDYVSEALQDGRNRVVSLAEVQINGRGRRGRTWISIPGTGFCGSFGWRYSTGFQSIQGLSLAVGVVIVETLTELGYQGLSLKWPNDIYCAKGKLGGVLIELAGEIEGPCRVVVGVGINIHLPERVKMLVDQPVADLMDLDRTRLPDRQAITLALIRNISELLDSFTLLGFGHWRERWIQMDGYIGKAVSLTGGAAPVIGIECGVDEGGALLINTASGVQAFSGGELSLRQDPE
jgi:BirA family biotin operon repressor/biotin-[acetyl-CoA-carboxylase] ligase